MSIMTFGNNSLIAVKGLKERVIEAERKELQMRPIKFRAWDKDNQQMFYDVSIRENHFCVYRESKGLLSISGMICEKSSIVLMQFTGLKDKNGTEKKEVYDGDIFIINENDDDWYAEVGWDNKRARFEFKSFYSPVTSVSLLDAIKSDNCRLVGNIHQNPELMEKDNGCK